MDWPRHSGSYGEKIKCHGVRNGIAVRITSMQEESANPWVCATYVVLVGAALDQYPFSPARCERILTKLVRKLEKCEREENVCENIVELWACFS